VCLTCVGGYSFSHSMNTHEPFMRFDGLLDSFSFGLGRVREHAYRAFLLVHDFVIVILLLVLLLLVP
jgi:phosphoglycerol transferase MdoB-like AlkP superfamily enzyme